MSIRCAAALVAAMLTTGCATVVVPPAVPEGESTYLRSVGFYQRKAATSGVFIARSEIAAQPRMQVTDLLRGKPGVRLIQVDGGTEVVASRNLGTSDAGCLPTTFVDGVAHGAGKLNEIVQPVQIEAIELHLSPASVGHRFTAPCGSVVIWTRSGR